MVKINPVKATCLVCQNACGLQEINDTCFGICAAFSETSDPYAMDPICSQTCAELVEQKKLEIYGANNSDRQVPYRPVIWNRIPRFIPRLIREGKSPNEAKESCLQMCSQLSSLVKKECQEKCLLDFSAIEEEKLENFYPKTYPTYPDEKKLVWLGVVIFVIAAIIIIILLIK